MLAAVTREVEREKGEENRSGFWEKQENRIMHEKERYGEKGGKESENRENERNRREKIRAGRQSGPGKGREERWRKREEMEERQERERERRRIWESKRAA